MKLLVDAGNSRVKWLALEAGATGERGQSPTTDETLDATLADHWSALGRADAIWACSVAGSRAAEAVEHAARRCWDLEVQWVRPSASALGVRCAYPKPETLGADRWAALVGARHHCTGAACILDCGTAITLDALDARGHHLGGLIVAGLDLARESLSRRAPGIPPASAERVDLFADSTAGAVAGGSVHGAAALADRFVAALESRVEQRVACLVTGGDGARVAAEMRSTHEIRPDLVLEGLACFAEADG